MLKRLFAILALTLGTSAPVWADPYGGFQQFADQGSLKPFTRDMGGMLGSATFHGGRSLGFSGFDVGGRFGLQFSPAKDDRILRNKGVRTFALPWAQAEVGMPFRLDGFVRGISYEGLTVVGGGLRFGVLPVSDARWAPQMLVSAVGHAVVHQYFSINHQGGSLVFSMGIPQFTPYVGAGVDRTVMVVRSSLADPTVNGMQVQTVESRFSAGMQLRPWQFIYMNVAYALLHGRSGLEGGLGLRF